LRLACFGESVRRSEVMRSRVTLSPLPPPPFIAKRDSSPLKSLDSVWLSPPSNPFSVGSSSSSARVDQKSSTDEMAPPDSHNGEHSSPTWFLRRTVLPV